jgi:hypothetical protein
MAISTDSTKRLLIALADKDAGNEVATAINSANVLQSTLTWDIVKAKVATASDQTTDFAFLQLGDKIVHFPVVAGNMDFSTCANNYAVGTVTYGASNGAQSCTINGTAVNFADPGTDAQNATALAAAITADPVLTLLVTAVVDGTIAEQVNITSKLPGTVGNYTLAVTGTGSVRSGATLTGGSTVGELPATATSGDLYWVLRAHAASTPSTLTF